MAGYRSRRRALWAAALTVPLLVLTPPAAVHAAPGSTVRVSVTSDGRPAAGYSASPVVSADGSTVAFVSQSALLHPSGTPSTAFYAHDRRTGRTDLLTVRPDGTPFEATGLHGNPVLSADGRYAVFTWASDPQDQTTMHLYRRDLVAGATVLVSTTPAGAPPDNEVTSFSVDGSGDLVAFTTEATDILPDGSGPGLFLHRVSTGTTERIAARAWDPALSLDGSTLVFSAPDSGATPVIWVRDLVTAETEQLVPGVSDESYTPSVSSDGRRVVFVSYGTGIDPTDTNPSYDWFLTDRDSGDTRLVTRTSSGAQAFVARAFLAADGRHVGLLGGPLDATGRTGIANLYVKDLSTGTLDFVAVDSAGTPVYASVDNGYHYLSGDGRFVAWSSRSTGFVPDDTDGEDDIFVHDNGAPTRTVSGTGSVTTDPAGVGATWQQPLQATVEAPSGSVTITLLGSSAAPSAPSGYVVLGQAVDITADPAPPGQWITVTLRLDGSTLTSTTPVDSVTLTRNGTPLEPCPDASSVGPCVASVTRATDGDLLVVARTPAASRWVPVLRRAVPDTTPPVISITSPAMDQTVVFGASLIASYTCSDDSSGVAQCQGSVPSGSALPTTTVGQLALAVTARDRAGNTASTSRPYRVVHDWRGFRKPIADPPALNRVKAGAVVPLAFSLGGDRGLGVLAGAPTDTVVTCSRSAPVNKVSTVLKSGAGTLTYSASTATYTYGLAVPKSWAASCRAITLTLDDGTTHVALLTVTK